MNRSISISSATISFREFIWADRHNRVLLIIAVTAIAIQFVIFKYFYPFASYIHGDSFAYLNAADRNSPINTYMIGYSKFLRLISVFTRSDMGLTVLQYLMIQGASLLLLFTLFYFYKPYKITQYIMLSFIVVNPLYLHLANLVSSDCIFTALSLSWVSLLLWTIHRPSNAIIVTHALILFIAFTVRYNALIYPIIAVFAFYISKLELKKKMMALGLCGILCGSFVILTMYEYHKLTGHWQYSPFSGWQMANNAMYTYRYVNNAERKQVPKKFHQLHKMINEYFDSTRDISKHPQEALVASTVYMWSLKLPLFEYRNGLFKNDSNATELKKWASMGPLYRSYGSYIITQYPFKFLQHFIIPNAGKYYAPPVEFLEQYNSGNEDVTTQAKEWFNYKSTKVHTRTKNNWVTVLDHYPILSGIVNVLMLFGLIFYLILKGWRSNSDLSKGIFLGAMVWLLNAGFTIFASSAALRFQSFPILLTTVTVALLIDWLWKMAMKTESKIKEASNENKVVVVSPTTIA